MSHYRKKLIEVALPLDEINVACRADKDRTSGTIRNLHKWFAPMPTPAWRALIYAALIDDPVDDEKRAYHLDLIKRLVANGADLPDEDSLEEARRNIRLQFPDGAPPVFDPFCGGGSTLVEAQRLGLPSFGSDLNPVPALISRTLTETLPSIRGREPLHQPSEDSEGLRQMSLVNVARGSGLGGYESFAQDVKHYAEVIRRKAWDELKSHYWAQPGESPLVWLWARTAECPNPACGLRTTLASTWWLSKKRGALAWLEPAVVGGEVTFGVRANQSTGEPPASAKVGDGVFACLGCGGILDGPYLRAEGHAGRLGFVLLAVVIDGVGGRTYRAATANDVEAARVEVDGSEVALPITEGGQGIRVPLYGLSTWDRLFTPRQLLSMLTISRLASEVPAMVKADGGDDDYATAIASVLGLAVGRLAMRNSTLARSTVQNDGSGTRYIAAFARNDLPMTWDFPEVDPLGPDGAWSVSIPNMLEAFRYAPDGHGRVIRADARRAAVPEQWGGGLVATDPPYFDAIGYADISDYFYVWHRRVLRKVHPDLYATAAAPKEGELTAIPVHHGKSKSAARDYFIEGFTETFLNLKKSMAQELPLLVVYASKEQKGGVGEESRWSSILSAMVAADLEITGTWPIHGTTSVRLVGNETNAVATYVVMALRPRDVAAGTCSLQDFNRALRRELKPAVHSLQSAGILPVDLAQAAMGPGMQVYSRYRTVLDQAGQPVPVEQALRLINQALSEVLDEQEGELDPDSRFAVTWWEKHHWEEASFGEADQLARPQGISVDDLIRAGVAVYSRPGFVRVVGDHNLDRSWKPSNDSRPTAWEAVHHLADRLIDGDGTAEAGALMSNLGDLRDQAQGLVYRLHAIAARKGWTKDQERYNALIGSWSDLLAESGRSHGEMDGLF